MKYLIIFFLTCFSLLSAQPTDDELSKLYEKLLYEINPPKADPDEWIITDTDFILDVFRQFKKQNFLKKPDDIHSSADITVINKFENEALKHNAIIKVQMGEREIYSFQFFINGEDSSIFADIGDFNKIIMVMEKGGYKAIKEKHYEHYDIRKNKPLEYEVNLNLLKPKLMLYSERMYDVSIEGQWGEDFIVTPAWFSPEYTLGINYARYSSTKSSGIFDRPAFSLMAGVAFPKKTITETNWSDKSLVNSGLGFYFKLSGKPNLFGSNSSSDKLQITASGKSNFSTDSWEEFEDHSLTDIYSNKNYFTLEILRPELFGISDLGKFKLGMGISFYDIYHLLLNPVDFSVTDLEINKRAFKKYQTSIFGEVGVENVANIVRHDFKIILNYESSNKYGYIGFLFNFLLSDTFGFDIRYYRTIAGKDNLPIWRASEYFVFSPVIRISN